jgi:hypothetical protein
MIPATYYKNKYDLRGFTTSKDLIYLEVNGRCYIQKQDMMCAVVTSPKRRKDLRPKLIHQSLRAYITARDIWYRNIEFRDVGINQFRKSRSNNSEILEGTWGVTFICKITGIRHIYTYLNNKAYMNHIAP